MSYECNTESGLIIPLRYLLSLINDQTADRFETSIVDLQFDLWEMLEEDQETFESQRYRFSRESYDFMANQVIQSFIEKSADREENGEPKSAAVRAAFGDCIENLFDEDGRLGDFGRHEKAVTALLGRVLRGAFGEKNVPSLKELRIFDAVSEHGTHWGMGGLFLEVWVGIDDEASNDEAWKEIYRKPCFIFDESECFRQVASPKGRRFKDLLGVSRFESSHWVAPYC
jgi:hypothetical protein